MPARPANWTEELETLDIRSRQWYAKALKYMKIMDEILARGKKKKEEFSRTRPDLGKVSTSYLKKRILVQNRGGGQCSTADILSYFED